MNNKDKTKPLNNKVIHLEYRQNKNKPNKNTYNRLVGLIGENIACKYLTNKGWTIIDRNIYYKNGEIDIIAIQEKNLVFFEVKTRTNKKYGGSIHSITSKKLSTLEKLASKWINNNKSKISFNKYRIDAILIDIDSSLQGIIKHIKGVRHGK